MTGLEGPLRSHFCRKERPTELGGEDSGDALVASFALIYRDWGIPAVLARGILGYALCACPGSFRFFSGTSTGQSQPYWGCGPIPARKGWATSGKRIVIGIDYSNVSLALMNLWDRIAEYTSARADYSQPFVNSRDFC